MTSAEFLLGNVLLRGELQINAINSNFDNFKSALYVKSVGIALNVDMALTLPWSVMMTAV